MIINYNESAKRLDYEEVYNFPHEARNSDEVTDWFILNVGFPSDSGKNWDAFEDSLRWVLPLQRKPIAIRHMKPSMLKEYDLRQYLDILHKNVREDDLIDFILGDGFNRYQMETS